MNTFLKNYPRYREALKQLNNVESTRRYLGSLEAIIADIKIKITKQENTARVLASKLRKPLADYKTYGGGWYSRRRHEPKNPQAAQAWFAYQMLDSYTTSLLDHELALAERPANWGIQTANELTLARQELAAAIIETRKKENIARSKRARKEQVREQTQVTKFISLPETGKVKEYRALFAAEPKTTYFNGYFSTRFVQELLNRLDKNEVIGVLYTSKLLVIDYGIGVATIKPVNPDEH